MEVLVDQTKKSIFSKITIFSHLLSQGTQLRETSLKVSALKVRDLIMYLLLSRVPRTAHNYHYSCA